MRTLSIVLSIFVLMLAGCSGSGGASVDVPTPIPVYTEAPTTQPTAQPVAQATTKPTIAATATPLASDTPTSEPSATPTDEPTVTPTAELTATATSTPTTAPTKIAATATFTPTLSIPTATVTATIAAPTAVPTAVPTATSESGAENSALYTGMPAEILALMPAADAANGQALTVSNGCIACHSLEKDVRVVGPSWYSVGASAGERVEGQSAGLYLYTSIVEPNAYINEGYIAGLMPQTYKDVLSNEQMADVIAYLLTMQGK